MASTGTRLFWKQTQTDFGQINIHYWAPTTRACSLTSSSLCSHDFPWEGRNHVPDNGPNLAAGPSTWRSAHPHTPVPSFFILFSTPCTLLAYLIRPEHGAKQPPAMLQQFQRKPQIAWKSAWAGACQVPEWHSHVPGPEQLCCRSEGRKGNARVLLSLAFVCVLFQLALRRSRVDLQLDIP